MIKEMYTVASNPLNANGSNHLLNVLFSGESQTKPSHRLGPKVYDFYLMHIVLSGKGIFHLNGEKHELHAGHTFLIEPEQLISYESDSDSPWRYRWVAFNGVQATELLEAVGFSNGEQIVLLDDIRRASLCYRHVYDAFRQGGAAAHLKAAGYLHLLLSVYGEARASLTDAAPRHHGESEQLHQQVVHYLLTQYTHPVSIEQMAESLGYNRAYLSRVFKQRTGMSPVTFLLNLRIDKARHLLREKPQLTVEQVAASVGLQDALYFSKQFRRLHGLSPTAYREAMKATHDSL